MGDDHLSRRRLITGIGTLGLGGGLAGGIGAPGPGAGATAFAQVPACKLTPSTKQGPYFFETGTLRGDIREDRPGVRLRLAIKVQDGETCAPLPGAVVEIWHCDAAGLYSGAETESRGVLTKGAGPVKIDPGAKFADHEPSDGRRYLRGAQVTDPGGVVRFTTIWPGWYPGRTVHVHVMVVVGGNRALCTELMFDENVNRRVLAGAPYQGHDKPRDTFNGNDPVFEDGMLVRVREDGDGYLGVVVLAAGRDGQAL